MIRLLRNSAFGMLVFSLLAASPFAAAASDEDTIRALRDDNEWMRRQLEAQARRLDRLESESSLPVVDATNAHPVTGKFAITLTGFLKTDFLWNNARLNSTSAPRFAAQDDHDDDQFTATVQHSRIIAKITGPAIGEGRIRGHVETDLFNLFDTTDLNFNNNQLRLRQLYVALDHPTWRLLLGQAWDLFSPLNVATLNTNGNYWFGGNAGFRRPQIQIRKRFDLADGHSITPAFSVNSNIGVTVTDDDRVLNSGRDAGIPVLEGSLVYGFDGFDAGKILVGASGLWGQEDVDGVKSNLDQWGIAGHVVLPLTSWLTLKGEIQHGENLDAFLMGGGIITANGDLIRATSGWGQITLRPCEKLTANAIYGQDDPRDSDLAADARSRNQVVGANLKYRPYTNFTLGVEYDYFDTRYKDAPNRDAHLLWFSGIFDF
jgi:hypothetical protein